MIESIDPSWTLFLDRDGVINERIPGHYISSIDTLRLTPGCRQAVASFNFLFGKIVVVTNQAGIGKGLMTEDQLHKVHKHISLELSKFNGKIHKFYHCPDLSTVNSPCRKPAIGMGMQAKQDFPEIDFAKSIMVGDSHSDMEFGKALGMKCILIEGKTEEENLLKDYEVDGRYGNLFQFAQAIHGEQFH